MQEVYRRCGGIDVHKKKITVCLKKGQKKQEVREYGTTTQDLREMVSWLKAEGCEKVAMESTGSYWKPIMNILEQEKMPAMLVNAAHMRSVPGRKTDVNDAEWIAELLQHGLLRANFVPTRDEREYRDATRYRSSRVDERAREINRLQKILEGANIKLTGFISDVTGKTAMRLIELLINNDSLSDEQIKGACEKNIKAGFDEIKASLDGFVSGLQKELIREILNTIREQTLQIERVDNLIKEHTSVKKNKVMERLEEMPGIKRRSAEQIIAEIGIDMNRFPTAHHLCAWGGVAPANNESAGKRKPAKSRKGNKTLKKTLVQCANAAIRNRNSFFHAQYSRLVVRLGKNKAKLAVAHSMLIAIYHVINGKIFKDLGSEYYTQFNKEKKAKALIKQLKRLGYEANCPDLAA